MSETPRNTGKNQPLRHCVPSVLDAQFDKIVEALKPTPDLPPVPPTTKAYFDREIRGLEAGRNLGEQTAYEEEVYRQSGVAIGANEAAQSRRIETMSLQLAAIALGAFDKSMQLFFGRRADG